MNPILFDSLFGELESGSAAVLAQGLIPQAASGHFDETRAKTSLNPDDIATLSAPWGVFFESLGMPGIESLQGHFEALTRQIRDDGATYNVHADAGQPQRPWPLDLFPLILNSSDWLGIEAGVRQRVKLLNAILADTYGPQRLLQKGLLPAALVRGHPGYLRAMRGTSAPDGNWLRIAAFDLVRAPDGLWRLLAQRVQAPSGLGYALENRLAISNQFPQAFQALNVQRLAATYTAFMAAFQAQCPAGESPHIALLTPGPYSETYFEQAYLARYLGITLVQGNDLTVRNERLFLKTIQGLQRVHGLIKRLDDDYLDPLELRADSQLGVPGLLQAIRAGNLLMANMPGTGFLESPALLGFLPALSQTLLGEPLMLPALPTWWCGERPALDEAARQLGTLVVKPTVRGSSLHHEFETVFTERLQPEERKNWLLRIAQSPSTHTIQQWAPQSQMPSWSPPSALSPEDQGHIRMKSVVLRVFALSDGPESWRVLPGGLARLADAGSASAAMRHGGSSADVWVRTRAPVDPVSRLPQAEQMDIQARAPVTSRAAENLFWLGRYTERAENSARLALLLLRLLGGEEVPNHALASWLLEMARAHGLVDTEMPDLPADEPLAIELRLLENNVLDALANPNSYSVGFNLRGLRNAAQAVRERLSQEQWLLIASAESNLLHDLRPAQPDAPSRKHTAKHALARVSAQLSAITGCQTDRMSRDSGWRLLYIGRLIERLGFLSNTLSLALQWRTLDEIPGFEAAISLFDSTITFHARHQQRRNLLTLCDLLITDRENPRSLAWVTQTMRSQLDKLSLQQGNGHPSLSVLLPDPAQWDPRSLCEADGQALQGMLQGLAQAGFQLSDAIGARSFAFSDLPPQTLMN